MSWAVTAIAGAGVVGAYVGYEGSQQSAQAAGNAATAQQNTATANRTQILSSAQTLGQNTLNAASASPQELNVLGQSYSAALQNVGQQQKLMSSIDPALMSASKQALQILQGGQSSLNQPMLNLRNSQRSQLMNQLTAQYGPGAENSSIGQRALQQFDMQTDSMYQQNQQQTLSQLMGIAGQGGASQSNAVNQSIGTLNNVGSGYSAIQNRITNANSNVMGSTLGALSGTNQSLINTAGAQYVQSGLQGQGLASLGNSIGQTGTLAALYGTRGGGGTTNNNPSVSPMVNSFSNSPNSTLQTPTAYQPGGASPGAYQL